MPRTTMSDDDLCRAVTGWVDDLCSRKREWVMTVPVDLDRDPDVLICELVRRFRESKILVAGANEAEAVEGEVR